MPEIYDLVGRAPVFGSGVKPKLHLSAFATGVTGGSPVVAMIGDSVSVGPDTTMPMTAKTDPASLANPIAPSELLWVLLKRKIRADNPGKNISFKNFAVAGQGWTNLAGVATGSFPSWYSPTSSNWLSFVQTAAPDLLIIALGANDGAGLTATIVKNALTVINGWAKVPSIIIVANWHASLAGGVVSQVNWNAQFANASFLRTLCSSNGAVSLMGLSNLPPLGLIDLGRYQQLLEDGTDLAVQSLSQVLANVSVPAGDNYSLPATQGDLYLDVTWPGAAGVFNFPGMTLTAGNANNYWNIFGSGGTGVGCQITYSGGAPVTSTRSSGAVTDSSKDIRLQLMNKNDLWLGKCNGTYFVDELLPRFFGASYQPLIAPYSHSANPYVINAYCIGTPRVSLGGIGDLATVGGIANASSPTDGGNGNNHPGSIGLAALHAAIIEATNFCAAEA